MRSLGNPPTPMFRDVPAAHPFYSAVQRLTAAGIVSGYADGTFRPDAPVTRGDAAKILVAAFYPNSASR